MDKNLIFINTNDYILSQYTMAYRMTKEFGYRDYNQYIAPYLSNAFGAFELFRKLCPEMFTDEENEKFWNEWKDKFIELTY